MANRVVLGTDTSLKAFRFVSTDDTSDPQIVEDFKSNHAKGKRPRGRELRDPEIHHGLSMFKSLAQAQDRRRRIAERLAREGRGGDLRIGGFAARVVLTGPEFTYEDLNRADGHLTVWGDPLSCVKAIVDVIRLED